MLSHYLTPGQAEIARHWQLADAQVRKPFPWRFETSPAATVPLLRLAETGALEQVAARWGLIPLWWKEENPPKDTTVAPSEEAATRPIWKIPAGRSRCLIPAIGWTAWRKVEQVDPATGDLAMAEQACFVRLPDRQPFAFAGLMSRRSAEGNQPEFSCTVLTRAATGPLARICDRMPIVLPGNAQAAWLFRELTDAAIAIDFAWEQAMTEFVHHAIDVRQDNARPENADFLSGGPGIQAANAPIVLGYGRPGEEERTGKAVNIVNDVNIVTSAKRL